MANQYGKYKTNQIKLKDGASAVSYPHKIVRGNSAGLVNPNWLGAGATDVNKVLRGDGTWGSIEAGVNYITNANAESDISGWRTYDDGGSLVDGIGGTSLLVFDNAETTNPIRGTKSFRLTKTSGYANQGISTDMVVASADLGKTLSIVFDYRINSGALAADDLEVWIFDIDNSVLLQPVGYQMDGGVTTSVNTFRATFITTTSVRNYRFILNCKNPTAAFQLVLDQFKVAPDPLGVINTTKIITDEESDSLYTNAICTTSLNVPANWGNGQTRRRWHREGNFLILDYTIMNFAPNALGIDPGSGVYLFPIPAQLGIHVDDSQIGTVVNQGLQSSVVTGANMERGAGSLISSVGEAYFSLSGVGSCEGQVYLWSDTHVFIANEDWAPGGGHDNVLGIFGSSWGAVQNTYNQTISFKIKVPILEWRSVPEIQRVNSVDDTRVHECIARMATNGTFPSGIDTPIWYDTVDIDTHGFYNPTNGEFMIPVSGFWSFTGALCVAGGFPSNGYVRSTIYKNGNVDSYLYGSDNLQPAMANSGVNAFAKDIYCNAGDIITIHVSSNASSPYVVGSLIHNFIAVKKVPEPKVILDTSMDGSIAEEVILPTYGMSYYMSTANKSKVRFIPVGGIPTVFLPSAGIKKGQTYELYNNYWNGTNVALGSGEIINLYTSGNEKVTDFVRGHIKVIAVVDNPTLRWHWKLVEAQSCWIAFSGVGYASGYSGGSVQGRWRRDGSDYVVRGTATPGAPFGGQQICPYIEPSRIWGINPDTMVFGGGQFRCGTVTPYSLISADKSTFSLVSYGTNYLTLSTNFYGYGFPTSPIDAGLFAAQTGSTVWEFEARVPMIGWDLY
jgi:hypothetical protein